MLALLALPAGSAASAPSASPLLQYVNSAAADPAAVAVVTQWWTVPGTADQFTAYVHALVLPGLTGGGGSPGDSEHAPDAGFEQPGLGSYDDASVDVQWIPDGDHVEARIDAQVIWLAPRTPLETLTHTAATATLHYTFTEQTPPPFGGGDTTPRPTHARRAVTGAPLRKLITLVNASPPDGPWERAGCSPGPPELATVALSERGHKVVIETGVDTCYDIRVVVDGRPQLPVLTGGYDLLKQVYAILGVKFTPIPHVPAQGPAVTTAAPQINVLEHNKVQAQRVGDRALGNGLLSPEDARETGPTAGPTRPTYTGPGHFVDRTWFFTVKGTRAQLIAWLRNYAPKGYVIAQPPSAPKGVRLVLEPTPANASVAAVVWITLAQRGDNVDWRVDAYTAWMPKTN